MLVLDGITYHFPTRLPKSGDKCAQYLLVRLLIGSLRIEKSGVFLRQAIDYSSIPWSTQVNPGSKAVELFLAAYGLGRSVRGFIDAALTENRVFYRELLAEFCAFHLHSARRGHTAAFISLYRILERMAYSVPLLYCATSRDFIGTFESLRDLFVSKDDGELKFFKNFIGVERGFIDKNILDTLYQIDFSSKYGYDGMYHEIVTKHFSSFDSTDKDIRQVKIKFKDVPGLLIVLRNRYFHAAIGSWKKNISSIDLIESDEFFDNLNPVFCSFLSLVALHIISARLSL
jgi:hypothetical protein